MPLSLVVGIVAVCLVLEAFFSGSELALISADRIRLQAHARRGSSRDRLIARFLERPQDLIAASLIGTNVCVVASTTVVTLYMLDASPERAELISVAIMAPLILVFGEIVPKSVFQHYADAVAPRAIYLLWGFYALFSPIVALASRVSDLILRGLRVRERRPFMTRDELRLLLDLPPTAGAGQISGDEKRMIRRIFQFGETSVYDVMLPLSEVCALPSTVTVEEGAKEIADKGYTRIPIYGVRIDEIQGVVHAFDVLRAPAGAVLRDVARKAIFVPESQPARDCLIRLQREGQGMAVVVDEYGGAVGIVTVEDILEEVVGEIEDEHDVREPGPPLIRREDPQTYRVQGRAPLARINAELRVQLPEGEDYETLAGLLLDRAKRIPRVGETVPLGPVNATVTVATDRSIDEVLLVLPRRGRPDAGSGS
jgi:CBS domain containing-hemolysin-like protein